VRIDLGCSCKRAAEGGQARGGVNASCGRRAAKGPARTALSPKVPLCAVTTRSRRQRIESTKRFSLTYMEWKISFDEVRHRLEPTLKPAEPPTVEEVLEQVSRHGVLRGPVDWVFPAWIAYVEYATQRVAETFQLRGGEGATP